MQHNESENKKQHVYLDRCLRPLLKLLQWDGNERMLFESLPHLTSIETIENFQWVMENLDFHSHVISSRLQHVDKRLFPCLFVPTEGGAPKILIEQNEEGLLVYDSEEDHNITLTDLAIEGVLVNFKKQSESDIQEDRKHWFRHILFQQRNTLLYIGFLTFLQTIFLVAPSVYIISIYDKVIEASSYRMLFTFSIGVGLILFALTILMAVRTRLLGELGNFVQQHIGNAIFKQLLKLPPIYTENASVGRQIIRLNDFGVIRDFFSGSLLVSLFEFPFLFIYFIAVWIVGGILVFVPVIATLIALLFSHIIWQLSKKTIHESTLTKSDYQDFLLESLSGMRSLQYAGLQKKWLERFRNISATSSFFSKKLQFIGSLNDTIFDIMTLLAGLATLVVGTILVVDNHMELGALIGTMFLIWRILTPIKVINTMLPKLIQLKMSTKQINELMNLPIELPSERQWKSTPKYIAGSIAFSQVTFRYPGADTPALKNISFSIKTGQTLLVIGPTASGKSTIGNLILAIYSPQAGYIYLDGRNIKQFDVNVLRKGIAYVPQKSELFYGTIAQNIALSQPLTSQEQIIEAARAANLLKEIEALPEGFNTRIKFYNEEMLGPSFCQKINLARAYLRDSPILIMDEPTGTLDPESVQMFEDFLTKIRGKKTIIVFAHNTKFMHLADAAVILYDGYIVTSGDTTTVMQNLPKGII
ncbi:MAG: hypothetical protein A3C44_05565 [Gammaproteobacteria bacterium RIFCSPHIGHO2_02_FULL_39_13]|nr:MAG: hypothetical protein A3C44_05565 [Gammaproteobacteria bacterium RIFCSPHIGHO2_02_FULL_39_13]OGT50497.1 MAG: hypothetical protein A3E53_06815 [Gammaproteobacteria bacterium RIFCSPHIGHO2_12_FULL_39_24]